MPHVIVILGCTASGKSDLGEGLAGRLGGRVLAVDSMQVYRGMDIGTAKPSRAVRARVPYLMVDVADPWEVYSAARFVADARGYLEKDERPKTKDESGETKDESGACVEQDERRKTKDERAGGPVVVVAGTILYLRSLMEGMFEGPGADEAIRAELAARAQKEGTGALHAELAQVDAAAAQRIHRNDLRRIVRALEVHRLTGRPITELQTQWTAQHPAVEATYIGIHREKELLNRRINARVKKMLDMGLVEEVRRLKEDPRGFSEEAASGVGYKQLLEHFAGRCTLGEAVEQIKIQTRYLAKMQRTWLKRWPGGKVHWLQAGEGVEGGDLVEEALAVVRGSGEC